MVDVEMPDPPRLCAGDDLPVESTKYDGSLHYAYTTTVVADDGKRLFAWAAPGTALRSYRGDLTLERPMLRLHDTGWDWNVEVHWEPDWTPRKHYVNIALPSTWDDGVLRFVDIDLDISWWADGRVALLDEDEFAEHRERFGYPPEVIDRAWAAVAEIRERIAGAAAPLDGSLYDWRPGRHPVGVDRPA